MGQEILERFPVRLEIPIAWGEMDAFQHVNNLVYLRWFESARMAYFEACDYVAIKDEEGVGPILRDSRIRYRIPLTFPGNVISATRVTRIEQDRFVMEHIVYSVEHQAVAAEGEAVVVCVNYKAGGKAKIPERYRQFMLNNEPMTPELFD